MKVSVVELREYEIEFTIGPDETVWTADLEINVNVDEIRVSVVNTETPLTTSQRYDLELYAEENGNHAQWIADAEASRGETLYELARGN